MPVTAHIPIRITLDPGALAAEGQAAIAEALRSAGGRALAKFDGEYLNPRGGYARPNFLPPSFTWNGGPVGDGLREQVEAMVARELSGLITPVADAAAARLDGLPIVMPADVSELFDPERSNGATYLVHSYEGPRRSPDAAVPTDGAAAVSTSSTASHVGWWHYSGVSDDYVSRAVNAIFSYYRTNGHVPSRLGVMCMNGGGDRFLLRIYDGVSIAEDSAGLARIRNAQRVADIWFPTRMNSVGWNADHSAVITSNTSGFSAEHALHIARINNYSGRSGFRDAYYAHLAHFFSIPESAVAGETAAVAATRRSIATAAESIAAAMADQPGAFCRIYSESAGAVMTLSQADMPTPELLVLPLAEEITVDPDAEEGEGGGGRGDSATGASTTATGRSGGEGGGTSTSGGTAGGTAPDAGPGGGTDAPVSTERFHYPSGLNGETMEIDLGPFEGEPSLDELGDLGEALRRLIRRIAFRLDMPEGRYCGSFLIAAAKIIGGRAAGLAEAAEFMPQATNPAPTGRGNLGSVDMQPEITPAVRLMRYLGGTCPLITELTNLMANVYRVPRIMQMFTGYRRGEWAGWMLDFHKEHTPAMKSSVGTLFIRTCEIMMLQLLRHSAQEISNRITNFNRYFPLVETLITRLISREAELIELRNILVSETQWDSFSGFVAARANNWRSACGALTTTISTLMLSNAAAAVDDDPIMSTMRGQTRRVDGVAQVNDGRGRWWTSDELERDIALRHETATSIDPLIHQLAEIPRVAFVFRANPAGARSYLYQLLTEMRDNNADVMRQVKNSPIFAFRSGRITEDLPNRTVSGTSVAMQGIHLMAHEAIGDAFMGDGWYGIGLDHIFSRELGRATLITFFETALVIVVSVICPPLGIALGVAIAGYHMYQASERGRMYNAFINPELLMSRSEVEFDMFLAQFEMVLSIIPDLGPILRGAVGSGRAVARGGIRALTRYARRQLMVSVGRQLQAGLIRGIATAVFIDRGMTLLLPRLLGPVMAEVNREITALAGGMVAARTSGATGTSSPSGALASYDPANPPHPERLMSMPDIPASFDPDAEPDEANEPSWVDAGMSPAEAELVRRLQEFQEGERSERLPPASEAP